MLTAVSSIQHGPFFPCDEVDRTPFLEQFLTGSIQHPAVFLGIPSAVLGLLCPKLVQKILHFFLSCGCFLVSTGSDIYHILGLDPI